MKLKSAEISNFKRFTKLNLGEIQESVKLIVLVGPNGSGKTSLFEAFNYWRMIKGYSLFQSQQEDYFRKNIKDFSDVQNWQFNSVKLKFHDNPELDQETIKKIFYFRTAYRNEADFRVSTIVKQSDPISNVKLQSLMINDVTVSENYQRLVCKTLAGIYDETNDSKSVKNFRNELLEKIKISLLKVFDDLLLTSIGNPAENGTFFFKKGVSENFPYKNLSAGEKCVFDILLDIIIKNEYYSDSILCIDEPEVHIHTKLQGLLLREIYNLTSSASQLWISTHSIGMLKEAEDIEKEFPGTVAFLDFGGRNFDLEENLSPGPVGRVLRNKFFDLAFAEFSELIAPRKIIFCEGTQKGRSYKDFDAQVYDTIFKNKYSDTVFISAGSCSEIENEENNNLNIVEKILSNTTIIKFIDRDDRSLNEIEDLRHKNIKVSKKRNIECYLLDDEIIKKLCQEKVNSDIISGNIIEKDRQVTIISLYEKCLTIKENAINQSEKRGNPADDIKSASGDIYTGIKKTLSLTQCGNNIASFLRDTMAPLITEDTEIYKSLENEIMK